MSSTVSPQRARAARLAVSTLFLTNGIASASILPRLPAIKDGLGLSNAELGAAIAAMPLGGLIAGAFAGILIARFGSRRVGVLAGLLEAVALAALGFAPSWAALAGAYFVMGVFDTTMDTAMNAHAVGVERVYGRSIMQGLHGGWSAGCLIGGAVGAVAAAASMPVSVYLALIALANATAILATARGLLPTTIADAHEPDDLAAEMAIHPRNAGRLLRVLVPIAMLGILCVVVQTAGATWSAVYATDVLGLSAGIAATGYVLFAGSMTLSRIANDRLIDRLGRVRLLRIGAALSVVAVLAVMAAAPMGLPILAFAGFALIGLGTSACFPIMATVAGSLPGIRPAYGVAMTFWLVRFGLMVAPALVGAAADAVGLTAAMWIPVAGAVAILVFAPAMTGRRVARAEGPT